MLSAFSVILCLFLGLVQAAADDKTKLGNSTIERVSGLSALKPGNGGADDPGALVYRCSDVRRIPKSDLCTHALSWISGCPRKSSSALKGSGF